MTTESEAKLLRLEAYWELTARKHTCLLGWNSGLTPPAPFVDNGSCCLVQTPVKRFVVTCEHVWAGYEAFHNSSARSQLWMSLIQDGQTSAPSAARSLTKPRAIAVEKSLDLAVFTFDGINDLESWRFWQLALNGDSQANKGDAVHFLGFPGDLVRAGATDRKLGCCYLSEIVAEVSFGKFRLHAPAGTRHHKNQRGEDGVAFRIGGASGAPVFKVKQDMSLALAGIVSQLSSPGFILGSPSSGGSGSEPETHEMSDGDVLVTHACFIQEDGFIVSHRIGSESDKLVSVAKGL